MTSRVLRDSDLGVLRAVTHMGTGFQYSLLDLMLWSHMGCFVDACMVRSYWKTSGGICQAPRLKCCLWDLLKSVATSRRCSRCLWSVLLFSRRSIGMLYGVEYHCYPLFTTAYIRQLNLPTPTCALFTGEESTSRPIASSNIAYTGLQAVYISS